MAKGWESKAVEDQIEESEKKGRGNQKGQMTPAQLEAHRRREVLLLSKARVQGDLQAAHNQRYQDQLNQALAEIEAQLSALEETD